MIVKKRFRRRIYRFQGRHHRPPGHPSMPLDEAKIGPSGLIACRIFQLLQTVCYSC